LLSIIVIITITITTIITRLVLLVTMGVTAHALLSKRAIAGLFDHLIFPLSSSHEIPNLPFHLV
jgi:hypothetical protein